MLVSLDKACVADACDTNSYAARFAPSILSSGQHDWRGWGSARDAHWAMF